MWALLCLFYQAKQYLAEHLSAGVSRLPPVLRRSTTPALAQYFVCSPRPPWARNSSAASRALLYRAICIPFISFYRFSVSPFTAVITTTAYLLVTHRPAASSDTFSHIPFRESTAFSDNSPGMCLSTEISKGSRCLGIAIGF